MKYRFIVLATMLALSSACGGSSNNDGILFRGKVTQGEEVNSNMLAHEVGEGVPGVQICALGSCDITNRSGGWSFTFNGARDNEVQFTVKEHGADTSFILNIPQNAKRVEIEKLLHTEVGDHSHDDAHDHEDAHDHQEDHNHDHSSHDHESHSHRLFVKHGEHLHLPSNNQVTIIRVLIDGMEYADAHEYYSHEHDHNEDIHHEEDHNNHHDEHDESHDHGHSH